MMYMGGNVPLTITITDALSPYSKHSASGGALRSPSHYYLWPFGLQIGLCPALHGHQPNRHPHLSRAASGASDAPCMPQRVPEVPELPRSLCNLGAESCMPPPPEDIVKLYATVLAVR